mgnify:CR=1 FL=1
MLMHALATIVAVILIALLVRDYYRRSAAIREEPKRLFANIIPILKNTNVHKSDTAGVHCIEGSYRDHFFLIRTVADTLALRKLPSLWLMVTLPRLQPFTATFDLMMRPATASTFSNFDFLNHTVNCPADYPEEAVLRSDDPTNMISVSLAAPHVRRIFVDKRMKELLISPKGTRLVRQLAEGDRARYGVFRQADFDNHIIDPVILQSLMDSLITLQRDIDTAGYK